MLLLLRLVAITAVMVAGCAASNVTRLAEADLRCEQVQATDRGRDTWIVRGCGQTALYQCTSTSGRYASCVNLVAMAQTRAEAELRCARTQMNVQEISPYIFRATGCGFEVTYQCEVMLGTAHCILERPPQQLPASTPPGSFGPPTPPPAPVPGGTL